MTIQIILKYFPDLSPEQKEQFVLLETLYQEWNLKINVVSRKDIDELYLRHVLHSLGIAKIIQFKAGIEVLDVGTGGGFPGIPLAILFPETQFTLVDSIGKKIKVADEVVTGLGLRNVKLVNGRVEEMDTSYHFIVSRAVASMPTFVRWVRGKTKKVKGGSFKSGIFYLKGGDLKEELQDFPNARIYELKDFYEEDFFDLKKVVYLPLKAR